MAISSSTKEIHGMGTRGKDIAKFVLGRDRIRNTAQFAPEVGADILAGAFKSPAFRGTDAALGALIDQSTEARITAVFNSVDAIKTRPPDRQSHARAQRRVGRLPQTHIAGMHRRKLP
jgi:hypothetical protein